MTYFADLTPYSYWDGPEPGTLNVGWLSVGHPFETTVPNEADLQLLWQFCKVAVTPTRGLHYCEFCDDWSADQCEQSRGDETLLLGFSEIRVVANDGSLFAAPSLIYHYVSAHHYRPPEAFLTALRAGPHPPSEAYFSSLRSRGLDWSSAW